MATQRITIHDARWVRNHLRRMCKAIGLPRLGLLIRVEFPARFPRGERAVGVAQSGAFVEFCGKPDVEVVPQVVPAEPYPFVIRIRRDWWFRANRARRLWVLSHELAHLVTALKFGDSWRHGARFQSTHKKLLRDYRFTS